MRLFTALEIPSPVINEIQVVQDELKEKIKCQRWQPLKNLHLTIHFFADVKEEKLPILKEIFSSECSQYPLFHLQLGQLGAFPRLNKARVLWLAVDGEKSKLTALEASIRTQLISQNLLADDRPYSPHITLARSPQQPENLPAAIRCVSVQPICWNVDKLVLFKSELRPSGAVHTRLAEYLLGE